MRRAACFILTFALVGCDAPGFFKGQGETPRWSTTQAAPVITERWLDGFVPVEEWNEDTLRIYGSGRWEATRAHAPSTGKPSVVVASGSISQDALQVLFAKAFERPLGGTSFLDLPAKIDPGVADAPVVTLGLSIENASHSVTVLGTKPEAFRRFEAAIASQTVTVPFPG